MYHSTHEVREQLDWALFHHMGPGSRLEAGACLLRQLTGQKRPSLKAIYSQFQSSACDYIFVLPFCLTNSMSVV